MKKWISKVLCGVIATTALLGGVGCGSDDESKDYGNKTPLKLGNVDLGLGDEWLQSVQNDFENAYADWQGEDGKVGVYLDIINKEDEFSTAQLLSNMPFNDIDLYFLCHAEYMALYNKKYEGERILADLSDVVKAKNYDDKGTLVATAGTGTSSIESRLIDCYRDYYNVGTKEDSAYYALPYYSTPYGICYDADLFDEQALYFKNGRIGATQEDIDNGTCDPGPDGAMGTYDDGMPATWTQFMSLLQSMKSMGLIPFIWSGADAYQKQYAQGQIYANYEGYNDYMLAQTFNGVDSQFGEITEKNGYLLAEQEGRLAMVKAAYDIVHNGYYAEESTDPGTTHTNAQMYYVWSIESDKRIAMLFEGSWWENEARIEFDDMAELNSDWGHGKRNFKYLPIPNFEGTTLATAEETGGAPIVSTQKDNRQVVPTTTSGGSLVCVSAHAKELELAKEFVKFVHSREMLVRMTQYSSCIRPYEYEFTPSELASCTKYTQSMLTLIAEDTTDVAWENPIRDGVIQKNSGYFGNWNCGSLQAFYQFISTPNASPYKLFKDKAKTYNAETWPVK